MFRAKCRSPFPWFGANQKTTHPIVTFNKRNRNHLQIQTHSKIPRFAICNEACPIQQRAACTIASGNVAFSDNNSDSDEDHGRQEGENVHCDPTFEAICSSSESHLLTQEDLNDLVREFVFKKKKKEKKKVNSGSRLKGCNLLHQDCEICFFCNRQNEFKECFSQENDLVYCTDIWSARQAVGNQHDPSEWRLFIDSSQSSLKAVLLHNGNKFPSVPPSPCR